MAASPAVTGRVWISWQQPTGVGAEPALYTHTGGELCFVVARVLVACPAVRLTKWLWSDWAGSGLPVNGGGYRVVGKDLQGRSPAPHRSGVVPPQAALLADRLAMKHNVAGREVKRAGLTSLLLLQTTHTLHRKASSWHARTHTQSSTTRREEGERDPRRSEAWHRSRASQAAGVVTSLGATNATESWRPALWLVSPLPVGPRRGPPQPCTPP